MELFGACKDEQYLMLVNLLDEISCFNFYFYTVFFRGGNFDSWLQSMLRASMIFINFRRRNHDKATLCQLWSPVPCVPKHRPWRNNRRISTSFFREKSRNISLHLATVGKFFILNVTYILSKCWKRKFKILWYVIAKPTRQPKFVPLNFVVLSSEVFDPTARL